CHSKRRGGVMGRSVEEKASPKTPAESRVEQIGLVDNGTGSDWVERYLMCDHIVDPSMARPRQHFEAIGHFIRDILAMRWIQTRQTREKHNPKRIYYLSMEFLIGRTLSNNIINLMAEPLVQQALQREGLSYQPISELEPDAGLGNGGLGRLAACFIDSLATLQYSAMGYGLRYEYGIFKQAIQDGYQREQPHHWLRPPGPSEVAPPGKTHKVP